MADSRKPSDARQQQYLAYDAIVLEREFAAMLAAYPELGEDEDLRADMIEGETDAHRVLDKLVTIEREADSSAKAIASRMADLAARKARAEKRKAGARDLMLRLLKAADLPRMSLTEATISVAKGSTSVEIADNDNVPKAYRRVKWEPNKTAIKEALEAGKKVRGAVLSTGPERLNVRVS